ncbi:hypothetical protein [Escherichia coli]|uniref:hypothetical protein n=1 Tax=Escherichia coli TaxID=562 RepID=UPI00200B1E6B|nr:hypothetical protein [Escherichia coli]
MEQHNVVPFLLIRPRQLHGRIQDTVKIKAERIYQVFSDDLSWYIAEIFFARQNRLDNPAGKCGQECGLLTSFYVVRIKQTSALQNTFKRRQVQETE